MKAFFDPCMLVNIAFFALLIIGCKPAPKGSFHEDALSLDTGKALQGFCAAAIMLHHLSQLYALNLNRPIACLDWICNGGVFLTAFFFFFSGYGLIASYKKKPDYLQGFLKKRLITVLVPFYLAEVIFTIIAYIFDGPFHPYEVLLYASGLLLCNAQLWYVVEISILYIAFYLIFRRTKNEKHALLYMLIFVAVLICTSVMLGHDYYSPCQGIWFMGEWWFNTTLCFPLGMAAAMYKESIFAFVKRHYALCLSISVLLFVGFHFASSYMQSAHGYYSESYNSRGIGDKFITLLFQAPEVILFLVSFLILTFKVRFSNKAMRSLGGFALELYVSHNIYVRYLIYLFPKLSPLFYIIICYALAVPTAYLLHKLGESIKKPLLANKHGAASGKA